jgi:hypothetical protein
MSREVHSNNGVEDEIDVGVGMMYGMELVL